jgi:prevent-host-death family protein
MVMRAAKTGAAARTPAGKRERRDLARESGALSVTATEAKNRFGPLLETAIQGRSIVITKHDMPKAVLMSMAEFESLSRIRDRHLATLDEAFDVMLEGMQTARSRGAMKAAFDAPPRVLGKLAVANARRRG